MSDILSIMQTKKMDPALFDFDMLMIGPMHSYLSQEDIDYLKYIATSGRLSSKITKKYKMIDDVMRSRGFRKFAAGTNRVVYSYYEDPRFLVKIAVDRVGMKDNPLEFYNQTFLKPFVTKMFYVSPCGTVGFAERVLPIRSIAEFKSIAGDVFDILMAKFIGKYVVDDVGTKYFRNWGIREGFGPVLLDYPYVYNLDGNKLYCNSFIPEKGMICGGEIDYDAGLNHLYCTCCGKKYTAKELEDKTKDNTIIIKRGGDIMKVNFIDSDGTVYGSDIDSTSVINKKPFKKIVKRENPVVEFYDGESSEKIEEKILQPKTTKEEFNESIEEPKLSPVADEEDDNEESEFEETSNSEVVQNSSNDGSEVEQDQTENSENMDDTYVSGDQLQIEDFEEHVSGSYDQSAREDEETDDGREVYESETSVLDISDSVSSDHSFENQEENREDLNSDRGGVIRYRDEAGRFTNKDNEGAKASITSYPRSSSYPRARKINVEDYEDAYEPTPTVKRMTSGKSEDRKKLGNMKDKDKKKSKSIKRIPQ